MVWHSALRDPAPLVGQRRHTTVFLKMGRRLTPPEPSTIAARVMLTVVTLVVMIAAVAAAGSIVVIVVASTRCPGEVVDDHSASPAVVDHRSRGSAREPYHARRLVKRG